MEEARHNEWVERWKTVSAELKRRVSPALFRLWLANLRPIEWNPARLVLTAHAFHIEWLQKHYRGLLLDAIEAATGETPELILEADDDGAVPPPSPDEPLDVAPTSENERRRSTSSRRRRATRLAMTRRAGRGNGRGRPAEPGAQPGNAVEDGTGGEPIPLNPGHRFDNYVTGPRNMLCHAAARAVAASPGGMHNPLYIHGSVGLGKTHLLQAICHEAFSHDPTITIGLISCETFVNQYISAIERRDLDTFRGRYRRLDMLLIDDVQVLANKERTQEEFFHTFNALHQLGRQIVLTSDVNPKALQSLDNRLISRFEGGLVTRVDPPKLETRVVIVHRKARAIGTELTDEVASFVAANITNNIRELEGAVNRLVTLAQLHNEPLIDLAFARRALVDQIPDGSPSWHGGRVSIDSVTQVTAEHFDLAVDDLRSRRRTRHMTLARHVAMFLCQKHTDSSLREIGASFGGRDHSSVHYAVKTIQERQATDEELASAIQEIEAELAR